MSEEESIVLYTNQRNGENVQEIFVPSLEIIANFTFCQNSSKVRSVFLKPSKHAEYFVFLGPDRQKPIIDHREVRVSKSFVDSLRDIKNYEQRLNKSKTDLFQSKDFQSHLAPKLF